MNSKTQPVGMEFSRVLGNAEWAERGETNLTLLEELRSAVQIPYPRLNYTLSFWNQCRIQLRT